MAGLNELAGREVQQGINFTLVAFPFVFEAGIDLVVGVAKGKDREGIVEFLGGHASKLGADEVIVHPRGCFHRRYLTLKEFGVVKDSFEIPSPIAHSLHDLLDIVENFRVGPL